MDEPIIRQTESIFFNPSLTDEIIAQIIVDKHKLSKQRRDIIIAKDYFKCKADIDKKSRVYYDKNKKAIENPAANNAKLNANFLRTLVQQKQDYGFAKTFVLRLSNEKEAEVDLTKDEYGAAWKQFCDKQLFKKAYTLAGQAVNNGIAWCYAWIDENGELKIKDMPSELVYPEWKDRQHTELTRLVYNFVQLQYNSFSPDTIEYAEYWTPSQRKLFNVSNGYNLEKELKNENGDFFFSHFTDGENWGKIPFICLKGTDDEKPLLFFIKEFIDSYNMVFSRGIDGIIDDLDPLLVIKDMSSELNTIIETRELIRMTRLASVSPDGDVHFVSAQTNLTSHLSALQALRHDIFKFGYGVDFEDARFGGNPNQLTIRSLYQDLDTYTDGLERHFQNFIDNLKYFFDKWWELTGRGSFDIAQSYKVLVKLDRSMMINQSSQIADTVQLMNTGVSQKTVMEFNPIVQDVEMEMARLEEEKKEKEAENSLFNFSSEKSAEESTERNEQTEKGESE